jgi:exopolysaccharide biosynthesis WecB/TagA/CpsF family protein
MESERVIRRVNDCHPDVLFVALGMPTQELWIARNLEQLNVHAILPAGSMMEYVAGRKTTAPTWMAMNGLEWLHRLGQEPGRLWRRYLIGNPAFIAGVIVQRLRSDRRS